MLLFTDNRKLLDDFENILPHVLPDNTSFQDVIKVCDVDEGIHGKLEIMADIVEQKAVCMFSS